ncbi:hypothetical protein BJ322DRAFT_1017051 [Thelephora terrestris]|uniref:Uncharacterized protein n=1 Tax=Thelephora terrestris TaxID=56493 RepID=A0A9P6HPQ5_9AGAM|nr:hypothetical protein BJ322DRAFT_1017051 [Thelephora terrestris]
MANDRLKGEMITLKDLIRGLVAQMNLIPSLVDQVSRLEDDRVRLTRCVSELTGEVRDLQRRRNKPEVRVEEEELMIPERAESPPAHFGGFVRKSFTGTPELSAGILRVLNLNTLDSEPNSDTELPDYDNLLDVDLNEIWQRNWEDLPLVERALELVQRMNRDLQDLAPE